MGFFYILDLTAVNAWVVYTEVTGEKISRRNFLSSLGEELSRTGNSSSHGEDASDDREEQWQLASGQVKIEYKGNMASITCQEDTVNLFLENVKAKNVEK